MLEEKITELKKEIVSYASLVEGMIAKGIDGFVNKKSEQIKTVIEKEEVKANNFEISMDELCTSLIAQFQPRARDLRFILMILKINNDLERMADHAVNISQSAAFLIEKPMVKRLIDIPKMSEVVIAMLKESITALIKEDVALAKDVCAKDSLVDDLRDQIIRELITFMVSDSSTIQRSLHILRVATNLERIADLSTNICEDIIFMVEGKIIKHHHQD